MEYRYGARVRVQREAVRASRWEKVSDAGRLTGRYYYQEAGRRSRHRRWGSPGGLVTLGLLVPGSSSRDVVLVHRILVGGLAEGLLVGRTYVEEGSSISYDGERTWVSSRRVPVWVVAVQTRDNRPRIMRALPDDVEEMVRGGA